MQVPPIFSALKQGGESLHRKARRGEMVTVAARPVTIHELTLLTVNPPDRFTVRVHCSAGTYIRSLAHDLGEALGTCAHLSALRRVAAGEFTLADALPLAAIEAAAAADRLADRLLPAGAALALPTLVLDDEAATRLGQGQKVPLAAELLTPNSEATTPLAKAVTAEGDFLGVVRALEQQPSDAGAILWKAEKWLAAAS
jgi:tRNA pseudouridine55 synthase